MPSTLLTVDKETLIMTEISAKELKWFGPVPSFTSLTNALLTAPAITPIRWQTALNHHAKLLDAKQHHTVLHPSPAL